MKKSGLFFIKKIFSSKLVLLAIFILAILLGLSAGKSFLRKYQINREIKNLEAEINKLENSNRELSDLIQYLNSDFFMEQEARLKLGLQKPGEKVIVIPSQTVDNLADIQKKEYNNQELSNPQKWWKYFFKLE